jgi:hypothetical protein
VMHATRPGDGSVKWRSPQRYIWVPYIYIDYTYNLFLIVNFLEH